MRASHSCFIVVWLFSSILVPGELVLIHFQRYVYVNRKFCLKPPNSALFSGENGKSLGLKRLSLCKSGSDSLKLVQCTCIQKMKS